MNDETIAKALSRSNSDGGATTLNLFTAADIMRWDHPPIKFVVPGYIAEGLTILAGTPKIGKSWLSLDLAVAISMGGKAFGSIEVEEGDVLYLALEDNERRLKKRLDKLCQSVVPPRLDIAFECPPIDKGGIEAIRDWVAQKDNPRLIIVDEMLTRDRNARRMGPRRHGPVASAPTRSRHGRLQKQPRCD
jgi:hypothetical protein